MPVKLHWTDASVASLGKIHSVNSGILLRKATTLLLRIKSGFSYLGRRGIFGFEKQPAVSIYHKAVGDISSRLLSLNSESPVNTAGIGRIVVRT